MVSHWLIDSSSSAPSSQQTSRFFPREVKNIKHDKYFPQGLERSRETIRTQEKLAELAATRCSCRAITLRVIYAPINVNPEGGGAGKGWGFDQSGGPMGRDLD
jgi:hypothetical protein